MLKKARNVSLDQKLKNYMMTIKKVGLVKMILERNLESLHYQNFPNIASFLGITVMLRGIAGPSSPSTVVS